MPRLPKAIDELKEKEELPELVELRQNKYLNNIRSARPPLDKTISQTRAGIRLVQHGSGVQ